MAHSSPYLLGIDIGTSGLKCLAIDTTGQVLAHSFREYAPDIPRPGWAEQDPAIWLQATVSAAREVVQQAQLEPTALKGIGFSGQMHSTVFLNPAGHPARPAILWLDQRSSQQIAGLQQKVEPAQLARWIGNPVMPGFLLANGLWVQEHEPETWKNTAHLMLPKDYIRYRLTGEIGTDTSDASSTALLNIGERQWCRELLDITGIPVARLPDLNPSTAIVGYLRPDMAGDMGLSAGIPVICGAGDQAAQAIGNGVIHPGLLSCTIGTGGQLFTAIDSYHYDPNLRVHVFCHAVPGLWHWLAATLTAGKSLRWLRDEVLAGRYSYQELADAAATVEPGAEGLIFLPYLAGERTPHMNPAARGMFYGLTLGHTWRHMARAVMEGVVFSLADGLDLLRSLGTTVDRVLASGGATEHPLWLQLQADVFGLDVVRTQAPEAAAFGAALLTGVGVGVYRDIAQACEQTVKWSEQVVQPCPERTERYRAILERYRALYPAFMTNPGSAC